MLPNTSTILNSLVSIIIKYHDSQGGVDKIVRRPGKEAFHLKADELIKQSNATDNLCKQLNTYIDQCTAGYPRCKPFLNFILSHIEYLQPILGNNKAFSKAETDEIIEHLYQLIIDAKTLLNTPKGSNAQVTWGDCKIDLDGLGHTIYFSTAYCNSGQILNEELFRGLNLSVESTDTEIKDTISQLVHTFNNTFLARDSEVQAEEISKLKAIIEENKTEIHQLRRALEKSNRNDELSGDIDEDTQSVQQSAHNRAPSSGFGFFGAGFRHPYPNAFGGLMPSHIDDEALTFP